jgi:Protein of unknown function (DUF4013)
MCHDSHDMKNVLRLRWFEAFRFMTEEPGWKRKVLVGGILLLFPPLGWPVALGYRKEVAFRLIAGRRPLLPEWRPHWPAFVKDGCAAVGVILVYFVPFLLTFWILALDDAASAAAHASEILLFFAAVPLLIPVFLPLLPPLYFYLFPWIRMSFLEQFAVGLVFWGTTFLMPAAFLQVSLHGRFRAAFRVGEVFRLVRGIARPYLEAWALSIAATALALMSGPLAPWGIFWSYLVIVHAFNAALVSWNVPAVRSRFGAGSLIGQS